MTERSSKGPTAGKVSKARWWALLVSAVMVVGGLTVAVRYAVAHPWSAAAITAGGAALVALIVVRDRSPRVQRWVDPAAGLAWRGYWRLTIWFFAAFGPILAARYLAELAVDVPLGVAVALLLVWVAVFLFLAWQVATESRRRELWRRLRGIDRVTPFLYPFTVAFVAIILFATLAFILSDRDVISFGTRGESATIAEPADALDFFVWHLLDSIPAFDVTGTLRWKEPLGYTDAGVGFLLLVFKIVVIAPIIAAFLGFWRYSREPADVEKT